MVNNRKTTMREERLRDNDMMEVLKMMSPGTSLKEGLENILRAKTGALIVIGDAEEVMNIVDGGFFINKEYSSAHLYELAKMDGAIIISKDLKRILYANAFLVTDPSIATEETGTRHKSAQRAAKKTGEIVISISQRRNIITIYKGAKKYILKDTAVILTRANQALQTLENYKSVLNSAMNNLYILEMEDMVSLLDVAAVVQRTEMLMRIVAEIDRYIIELGNEGRLISMQLEELVSNIEEDCMLVIEDYMINNDGRTPEEIVRHIKSLGYEELMDMGNVCRAMGYAVPGVSLDISVSPKGYRVMSRVPKVPMSVIKNLILKFCNLQGILKASIEELDEVEGIGEVRAKSIKEGLKRLKEQLLIGSLRR